MKEKIKRYICPLCNSSMMVKSIKINYDEPHNFHCCFRRKGVINLICTGCHAELKNHPVCLEEFINDAYKSYLEQAQLQERIN